MAVAQRTMNPLAAVVELLVRRPIWAFLTTNAQAVNAESLAHDVADAVRLADDTDVAATTWRLMSEEQRQQALRQFETVRQMLHHLLPELPPLQWRPFLRAVLRNIVQYYSPLTRPLTVRLSVMHEVNTDRAFEEEISAAKAAHWLRMLQTELHVYVAPTGVSAIVTHTDNPLVLAVYIDYRGLPIAEHDIVLEDDAPPAARYGRAVAQSVGYAMRYALLIEQIRNTAAEA